MKLNAYLRSKVVTHFNNLVKKDFHISDDLLDKWLYKETVVEFVIGKNNLRDSRGRLIGMKALQGELEKYGYKIESKRKKVEGKLVTQYCITKM